MTLTKAISKEHKVQFIYLFTLFTVDCNSSNILIKIELFQNI